MEVLVGRVYWEVKCCGGGGECKRDDEGKWEAGLQHKIFHCVGHREKTRIVGFSIERIAKTDTNLSNMYDSAEDGTVQRLQKWLQVQHPPSPSTKTAPINLWCARDAFVTNWFGECSRSSNINTRRHWTMKPWWGERYQTLRNKSTKRVYGA